MNIDEFEVQHTEQAAGDAASYSWEVKNVAAFESEPYGPKFRYLVPRVLLTPKNFEVEGMKGSMSSWGSIGKWSYELGKDKKELPEGAIEAINRELVGAKNDLERAERIYKYVQNSTRYVSVQLGIGGWQPFDPTYVFENGYGDCKALTNYTQALLQHAGIESFYTLVKAGRGEEVDHSFPSSQFNHVFLAVPIESDTVWLECTSQTNPFGYLGSFTSDRHVLVTSEEGGKLIKSPGYDEKLSTQIRTANVKIDKAGNATATVSTAYGGLQYENVEGQLFRSPEDQKKWLERTADMSKTKILKYTRTSMSLQFCPASQRG